MLNDAGKRLWGIAIGLASFGRVRHLTRSRPLMDTAGANAHGQTRSTHSLATQSAGQTDVCLVPAEPVHLIRGQRSFINNKESKSQTKLYLFIPLRPDGRVNGKIENLDLLSFYIGDPE